MSGAKRVCVLVLGDIGHSPRMQYHSLSLADHRFHVDLVGYRHSLPHESVLRNDNIDTHVMNDVPNFAHCNHDQFIVSVILLVTIVSLDVPRVVSYALKVVWQSAILLCLLLSLPKPNHILVQNPPSIPTLAIAWLVSRIRGSQFIIDWHNYGFTILSLSLSDNHLLVRTCRWFEGYFGSKGDHHLCVTNALKHDLLMRWKISATVLYDRPPSMFREISIAEKHNLFIKLQKDYTELTNSDITDNFNTIFTSYNKSSKTYFLNPNRPALIISSTSWTEDEDFNILLEALQYYESYVNEGNDKLPKLMCVITGKGPLKEYYVNKISTLEFKNVQFMFPWLSAEDYPKILASADIGISLHKSSSNLDLPMKVVDMFGCCLPVCALHYKCINELVKDKENGLLFNSSDELALQLKLLLNEFPNSNTLLSHLRCNLRKEYTNLRWDQCWNDNVLPIFEDN